MLQLLSRPNLGWPASDKVKEVPWLWLLFSTGLFLVGCRKNLGQPAVDELPSTANFVAPLSELMLRIYMDKEATTFFKSMEKGNYRICWEKAQLGAIAGARTCLVPVIETHRKFVKELIAIQWGKQLRCKVLLPTGLENDSNNRLGAEPMAFPVFEFLVFGKQQLASQGIHFITPKPVEPAGQTNGRLSAHVINICYSWTTCIGDGWGNCVGATYYHKECFSETIWSGEFSFSSNGDPYPGYSDPSYGGGGSGPSAGNNEGTILPPPKDPIPFPEKFLACFDLSLPAVLTVYADQPTAGDNDPVSILGGIGHTFLTIEQQQGALTVRRTVGFYAASRVDPFRQTSAESMLGHDQGHNFDVSLTQAISAAQLKEAVISIVDRFSVYDIAEYNCTNFVLDVAGAAGLSLPRTKGWWIVGSGYNPGDFGQDLRALPAAITVPGTAPADTGFCN